MKRITTYFLLLLLALFVNGCYVTSRTRKTAPITYASIALYQGRRQYITLNEVDHQFYYQQNRFGDLNIIGLWNVSKDTLYLHPALMYEYHRGDTIATERINVDNYDKINLCPLKFLMRGKKGETLEDITDYSDVVRYEFWYKMYKDLSYPKEFRDSLIKHFGPDSIIPSDPERDKNDFILSSDFEKILKKRGKMREKQERQNNKE